MVPEVVTVSGIARDIRESRLDEEALPQMYLSIYRDVPSSVALIARGTIPPPALLIALERAVRAIEPSQAVFHIRTMDQVVNNSVASRRTNTQLIGSLRCPGSPAASLGVYAVVAHGVTQRSREFGIRSALGATGSDLLSLISREMVSTTLGGIAAGLIGAWLFTRLAEKMFFGVAVHDPADLRGGTATTADSL